MSTAKIFWSGRSQAVRLPKEFRFDAAEVNIRRHGNMVVLEPVVENWAWLDVVSAKLDKDFIEAANEKSDQQDRSALDELFK